VFLNQDNERIKENMKIKIPHWGWKEDHICEIAALHVKRGSWLTMTVKGY
jgi:hypothetical protein